MIKKTKRKNKLINKNSKKKVIIKNIKSKKTINNIGGARILSEKEQEALKALMDLYNTANLCEILKNYYHKPLLQAATEIGICSTAFKKICRKCGIKKWPFRSITSKKVQKEHNQLSLDLYDNREKIQYLTQLMKNQESE